MQHSSSLKTDSGAAGHVLYANRKLISESSCGPYPESVDSNSPLVPILSPLKKVSAISIFQDTIHCFYPVCISNTVLFIL
jgi:hypothetical protein